MTPKVTIIVLIAWTLVQLVWHPGTWWLWVLVVALLGGGFWEFFAHQRSRRTNWGVGFLGECPKSGDKFDEMARDPRATTAALEMEYYKQALAAGFTGEQAWALLLSKAGRFRSGHDREVDGGASVKDDPISEPKGLFRLDLNDIISGELPTEGHRVLCQQLDITLPDGRIMQVRKQMHGSGLVATFEAGERRQVKRYRATETIYPPSDGGGRVNQWGERISSCW